MLDLRDPEAVVPRLDEALRSFKRTGAVPAGVRELLFEFSEALAESTPREAGLLSGRELVLARERVARGIQGLGDDRPRVQCREAKRALGGLRQMYAFAARSAAVDGVDPFWLRRRERPVVEEVQRLLAKVKVDQRLGDGSRTLLREPVVIVHGVHRADFELLDERAGVWGRRSRKTLGGQCVSRKAGAQRMLDRSGFRADRNYAARQKEVSVAS